jgi:hypothetical protein
LYTRLDEVINDLLEPIQDLAGMEELHQKRPLTGRGLKLLIDEKRAEIRGLLEDLLRFPPLHKRHAEVFNEKFFQAGQTYANSVFIMTKFPDSEDPGPDDIRLGYVIRQVAKRLEANGYHPRIASDSHPPYFELLWDNVEAYLLCCGHGVAIVEDKCRVELNPNVTMEWGWMRAFKKNVLFLVENDFKHLRADESGIIQAAFSWNDPLPGIAAAIDTRFPEPKPPDQPLTQPSIPAGEA